MSCLADVTGRLLFSEGRQKGRSEGVGGIEVGEWGRSGERGGGGRHSCGGRKGSGVVIYERRIYKKNYKKGKVYGFDGIIFTL